MADPKSETGVLLHFQGCYNFHILAFTLVYRYIGEGRSSILGGGAECKCNKSVTTLAHKACHLGGSGGMLPKENFGF